MVIDGAEQEGQHPFLFLQLPMQAAFPGDDGCDEPEADGEDLSRVPIAVWLNICCVA